MSTQSQDKHPFAQWRWEALDWSRALRSAGLLGGVVLAPAVAERIAAMLLEAEPPGTGAQQVAAGYRAGLADREPLPQPPEQQPSEGSDG